MPLPTTIEEVLDQLDQIVAQAKKNQSRMGYFALLYREVTAAVKQGIIDDYFEDGARMEQLDVVFANRYIAAYQQYQAKEKTTKSWRIAFDATERTDLLILQHLMLGMNAHINLDLAIAAATIAPGNEITDLETDFFRINEILFSMIDTMQDRLAKISPLFGWLDKVVGVHDEKFATFSLRKARDHAWNLANLLAPIPSEYWDQPIHTADESTAILAGLVEAPKLKLSRWTIRLLKKFEAKEVVKNMELLG